MTKKVIAITVMTLALTSCAKPHEDMSNYRCSKEQLELVKTEKGICEDSGLFSSYCFEKAKITQCDYMLKINTN